MTPHSYAWLSSSSLPSHLLQCRKEAGMGMIRQAAGSFKSVAGDAKSTIPASSILSAVIRDLFCRFSAQCDLVEVVIICASRGHGMEIISEKVFSDRLDSC